MGDTAAIESYLGAGGSPDALDPEDRPPLLFAAGYGRAAAAKLLLDAGASLVVGPSGTSALHRLGYFLLRP